MTESHLPEDAQVPDDASTASGRLSDLLCRDARVRRTVEACRRIASGFDGLEILQPLGSGGEGTVFEARTDEGRRIALKVLSIDGDSFSRRRSGAEQIVENLQGIDDPGLCCPEGVLERPDEGLALVMEFVEGVDLADAVRRAGHPVQEALRLTVDVARSLHHSHQRGIVHGDLKPSNIIVRENGTPVVVDFGTSVVAGGPRDSESFKVKGTLGFLAPEQVVPGSDIDPRTDVFGLGVTLHLLLTGTVRPAGERGEFERVLEACEQLGLEDEPAPIEPDRLARVLCRATALDPSERFRTLLEFADAVGALVKPTHHSEFKGAWYRRYRHLLPLGGLVGTLVLLAGGYLAWQGAPWRGASDAFLSESLGFHGQEGHVLRILDSNLRGTRSPGQRVDVAIDWTLPERVPSGRLRGRVFAEWAPETPIATIHDGPAPPRGTPQQERFTLRAPEASGVYLVRMILTKDSVPKSIEARGLHRHDFFLPVGPGSWSALRHDVLYVHRRNGPTPTSEIMAILEDNVSGRSFEPDQEIAARVAWAIPYGENFQAIFRGRVFGSWAPDEVLSPLHDGLCPPRGEIQLETFAFRTPSQPGTYALRLVLNASLDEPASLVDVSHYHVDLVFRVR